GEKRLKDIEAEKALLPQLQKKVADARRFEVATTFDPENVESLAGKAIRLEEFGDKDKAARTWDAAIALAEKDVDLHIWQLLAAERRALLPKGEPDGGLATRQRQVASRLADLAQAESAAKDGNEAVKWIAVRVLARDVVELYDDESD